MVSIDSEHSSRVHTFTEGVDYHIDSMIIKHHLFIGIDLENDTTHEKSHITVIFCPMAHAASSKLRKWFKEIYEHTQDGLNRRPGGKAMMFLISDKMFHKCICASHTPQELIVNIQKQDALGEMHAMSVDAKLISS